MSIPHHRPRRALLSGNDSSERVHQPEVLPPDNDLPQIICTERQLEDVRADVLKAVQRYNRRPTLFLRGTKVVSVVQDERGRAFISEHTGPSMKDVFARAAHFFRQGEFGPVPCFPPSDVVSNLLSSVPARLGLPTLIALIEAPGLRPNGTIISDPGYDPDTGLYYVPRPGLDVPPIREEPTEEEVFQALALILELLVDFRFADEASSTNAIATILTAVIRSAIAGPYLSPSSTRPLRAPVKRCSPSAFR